MRDYAELPNLSTVELEESYVLEIVEESRGIRFRLDVVLTPEHPDPAYHQPEPGKQYCMARGWLIFDNVTKAEWQDKADTPIVDASGEEDWGNIDSLKQVGDHWFAEGYWGKVRIYTGTEPRLTFDGAKSGSNPPRA